MKYERYISVSIKKGNDNNEEQNKTLSLPKATQRPTQEQDPISKETPIKNFKHFLST